MVDISQDTFQSLETPLAPPAERRVRTWYNFYLLIYLVGPGLVALAIMGWIKAT